MGIEAQLKSCGIVVAKVIVACDLAAGIVVVAFAVVAAAA